MPQRPRPHQLEDESRLAFRRLLPSAWIARQITPDYGIDEHVEIFSDDGSATGRSFVAQLKGTDEEDLTAALAVRLRVATEGYLREQDLPVLIVLYHAPSGAVFARWFHSFDPHYGRSEQQSTTYRLSEADLWTDSIPTRIVQDVEAFRALRTSRLTFPIDVAIRIATSDVGELPASEIRLGCRDLASQIADLVRLRPDSEADVGFPRILPIEVRQTETVVNPGGAKTVTLHHNFDYDDHNVRRRVPGDIWMTLGLWLGHLGEVNAAARMVKVIAPTSNVLLDPESLFRILGFFVRSHRVVEALELAEFLEAGEHPDLSEVSQMIQATAVINAEALSTTEKGAVEAFLRRRSRRADETQDADHGRTAHYTLGNFLRGEAKHAAAFEEYCRASALDPTYWQRSYFPAELAGILFGMGRYENAAHFYGIALELEDDEFTRALYADALMLAGQYSESKENFEAYLARASRSVAEFRLKAMMLDSLVQRFGPRQERDSAMANELATIEDSEAEDVSDQMLAALQLDALCGLAWFNMGVNLTRRDNRANALQAFLMAALSQPNDVEAWTNAFGLSLASGNDYLPLGSTIFEAGFRLNGTRFLDALRENARAQPGDFPVDDYLQAIEALVAALPAESSRPTIRFLGEGPDFTAFDFGPPERE